MEKESDLLCNGDKQQMVTCAEQQLCEIDMLRSMYSKDEIILDSDCAAYVLSYCDRCLTNEDPDDTISEVIKELNTEEMRLGFTLKLLLNTHPVEVKCDLPQTYPFTATPHIFVRTSALISRQNQSLFRQELDGFISELELGDAMLFTILNWINENLPSYIVSPREKPDVEGTKDTRCSFSRMWIYSHHIYSKFKRRDIIAWASELCLHGFSMCGKPGMVCIEGYTEDVEEFWSRLRRLNWKRLVMKEREDTKCDNHTQLRSLFRFESFEEKVFGAYSGKGLSANFHSDIGHLRIFLQEHRCAHIFEMYFGIDGGGGSGSGDTEAIRDSE